MWKAIVKLIEKWSYSCPHEWEKFNVSEVWDRAMYEKGVEVVTRTETTFLCNKCLCSKKIIT
jgi:hypothetical protein